MRPITERDWASIRRREAAFWANVPDRHTDGCWSWRGYVTANGYGCFTVHYRRFYAHRLAYLLTRGEIPGDLCVDHLCRNRACVNPGHMELVTLGCNVLRGEGASARQARQTHCKNGHASTPDNIYQRQFRTSGKRQCITCSRALHRAIYAARKQPDGRRSA